jgi:UDP-MurNAc hydroxylase
MQVEYVTHASLLVRTASATLLLDPFFGPGPEESFILTLFPPRDGQWFADDQVIDYVFSSHVHPDHSHPETLATIRPRVRSVVLPGERPALSGRRAVRGAYNAQARRQDAPRGLRGPPGHGGPP